MSATADPQRLFSERLASYDRFIRWVRYPQGLRLFFRASPLLRSDLRVLDAGCGTGAVLLGFHDALVSRGLRPGVLHGFDLTPAMLDHLRGKLQRRGINDVQLAQADVLRLDRLPEGWSDYDLILSASMLEYVPRERFAEAIGGLRRRLGEGGTFVLFMTRRNPLTRWMIGRWWQSNLYSEAELEEAFRAAGFRQIRFRSFPLAARYLRLWGHVVEAQR